MERVVPSTVLLAAIHYKGSKDGPTIEYVLKFNHIARTVSGLGRQESGKEESEFDRLEATRSKLLSELGIWSTVDFEVELAAFLKSGLLDDAKFDPIFDRYNREKNHQRAQVRYREFFEAYWWEPQRSEAELVHLADEISAVAGLLSAFDVTDLNSVVSELPDGLRVVDRIIDVWIEGFRRAPPPGVACGYQCFACRRLKVDGRIQQSVPHL